MDELATRACLRAGYQGPSTINYTQVSAHFCLCLNQDRGKRPCMTLPVTMLTFHAIHH
jgi:hypothetical protein